MRCLVLRSEPGEGRGGPSSAHGRSPALLGCQYQPEVKAILSEIQKPIPKHTWKSETPRGRGRQMRSFRVRLISAGHPAGRTAALPQVLRDTRPPGHREGSLTDGAPVQMKHRDRQQQLR